MSTKGAWPGSLARLRGTHPPPFTGPENKEMKKLPFGRLEGEFKVHTVFSLYIYFLLLRFDGKLCHIFHGPMTCYGDVKERVIYDDMISSQTC